METAVLKAVEKTKGRSLRICDCGLADYQEVLRQQEQLCKKRRQGVIPNTVLIAEHRPAITLGARQNANKLLADRSTLAQKGIDVIDIRRGGGTTAHNPGQLVFYPILNLQELRLGINEYIRTLEQIGIELLEQFGVKSEQRKNYPGLWVKNNSQFSTLNSQFRKIASIGVRVSKCVTYHGMAINICNDLSIFDYIVPCGLENVKMTSVLNETGKKYPMNEVKSYLSHILSQHFKSQIRKLPPWLKRPLPAGGSFAKTSEIISSLGLQTICHSANCPNRGQCWEKGTATVLILGNVCTRKCGFCSVKTGPWLRPEASRPAPPDPTEPKRLAKMVKQMGLKYLVITSVNRDDLPDGGAGHFHDCINTVREQSPDVRFEILVPDFRNCQTQAIEILGDALPFVFAHNVETVPSLYSKARSGGDYQRSLNLLKMAKESYNGIHTKSSIMLGLGETDAEVEQVLTDLRNVCCDRVTIGQYLKPSKKSLDVVEYIPPAKFDFWKQKAVEMGFSWVLSSPFARSSYFAEQESTL